VPAAASVAGGLRIREGELFGGAGLRSKRSRSRSATCIRTSRRTEEVEVVEERM